MSATHAPRSPAAVVGIAAVVACTLSLLLSLIDLWQQPPARAGSADAGMMGGLAGLVLLFHVGLRLVVAGVAVACAALAALWAQSRVRRLPAAALAASAATVLALLPPLALGGMDAGYAFRAATWLILPAALGALLAALPIGAGGLLRVARAGLLTLAAPRVAGVPASRPAEAAQHHATRLSEWATHARQRLPLLLLAFVAYAGAALLLLFASPVAAPWADPDLPFGTLLRIGSQPWLGLALRAGMAPASALLACAAGLALNLALLTWLLAAWLGSAKR